MNEQGIINEIKAFFSTIGDNVDLLFERPIAFLIKLLKNLFSVFIVVMCLFILDSFFRWTDHFQEERKLDRYEKIQSLLTGKDVSPKLRQSLMALQNEIILEKNYKEYLRSQFNYVTSLPERVLLNFVRENLDENIGVFISNILNFNWLHFITSSWLLFILFISMTIQIMTGKNLERRMMKLGISLTLFILGGCFAFSNLFIVVNPFSSRLWSSAFNITAHGLMMFFIIAGIRMSENKNIRSNRDYLNQLKNKY